MSVSLVQQTERFIQTMSPDLKPLPKFFNTKSTSFKYIYIFRPEICKQKLVIAIIN